MILFHLIACFSKLFRACIFFHVEFLPKFDAGPECSKTVTHCREISHTCNMGYGLCLHVCVGFFKIFSTFCDRGLNSIVAIDKL